MLEVYLYQSLQLQKKKTSKAALMVMQSIGSVHLQEKAPHMLTSVNTDKYIYKQCGEGSIWCHQLNLSITDWEGSVLINTSKRYLTAHCTMVSLRCKTQQKLQQKLNETSNKQTKNITKKNKTHFSQKRWGNIFIVTGQNQARRLQSGGISSFYATLI